MGGRRFVTVARSSTTRRYVHCRFNYAKTKHMYSICIRHNISDKVLLIIGPAWIQFDCKIQKCNAEALFVLWFNYLCGNETNPNIFCSERHKKTDEKETSNLCILSGTTFVAFSLTFTTLLFQGSSKFLQAVESRRRGEKKKGAAEFNLTRPCTLSFFPLSFCCWVFMYQFN